MRSKITFAVLCLMGFFGFGASPASAQLCPTTSSRAADSASQVRTLDGRLIYHNGIRQWFELKLDKPTCGQKSIQLTSMDDWKPLETSRGCHVRSTGQIDFSPTGYYSLELYQDAKTLMPVNGCVRRQPLPDLSSTKPDRHVQSYRVDMHVDYRPGDHPIKFRATSDGAELRPWQAYARYQLTGGYVLYGSCGDGFVVDRVFGTNAAHPEHFTEQSAPDDMATFDPESAAESGTADLHLGYTCIREPVRQR